MQTKTMKPFVSSLVAVVGLAAAAFADEEPSYKMLCEKLTTDGIGYIVTDYVPNHRRTFVEISAKANAELDGVALLCANGLVSGEKDYGTVFYGHFDGDLTFNNVGEDVQVCPEDVPAPAVNAPFVIRYFRNSVAVSYDGGATFATYDGGNPDETYPDGPAGGKMMLFGSMCPNVGERYRGDIYAIRVLEISPDNTETNEVMDLVPALSKDNVKTLYDRVHNTCLTPTDAGGFVAAPFGPNFAWSGAGSDNKWSTPENWTNGVVPGVMGSALFKSDSAADRRRVLFDEGGAAEAPLVQDFNVGADVSYVFSSTCPVWAVVSGLSGETRLTSGEMEVTGSDTEMHFLNGGARARCLMGNGSSLKVSDGASVNVSGLSINDNEDVSLIASNANSTLAFTYTGNLDGANPKISAYAGGTVKTDSTMVFWTRNVPQLLADGAGSTLDLPNVYLGRYVSSKNKTNGGSCKVTSRNGGSVTLGGAYSTSGTAEIVVSDGGTVTFTALVDLGSGTGNCPKLAVHGDGATLIANNKLTFGRGSGANYQQVYLTPTLKWSNSSANAPIRTTGSSAFTINTRVKYYVDVTAFTNYYGSKKMAIAASAGNGTFSFTAPPAALSVELTGAGAELCSVTSFAKGTTITKGSDYSKCAYLTITSANVPEGMVAAVNNSSKFFDNLPDAVAAAKDGETVMLFGDVTLADTLKAEGKTVTISAPAAVVIRGRVGGGIAIDETKVTVVRPGLMMYVK